MAKILFNKATEVLLGVWADEETAPTSADVVNLRYIIADSLSMNQDDADENTIDNELSDDPILQSYSVGAYKVDLNNASIDPEFLTKIMGWEELASDAGFVSPQTYTTKYISIQIKFSATKYIYMPKVAIAPKLIFESLKTNVGYGTLSGTATAAKIGDLKLKDGTTPAIGSVANLKAPILTATAA